MEPLLLREKTSYEEKKTGAWSIVVAIDSVRTIVLLVAVERRRKGGTSSKVIPMTAFGGVIDGDPNNGF